MLSDQKGTSLLLHPGLLPGGSYHHSCHLGRPIGYYLEALIPLAPFCKKPLELNLTGITGQEGRDMTVGFTLCRPLTKQADMIRTVTLPHLHLFGITDGLELQVRYVVEAPLNVDQETRICAFGGWPGRLQMSGGQATTNNPFPGERQD